MAFVPGAGPPTPEDKSEYNLNIGGFLGWKVPGERRRPGMDRYILGAEGRFTRLSCLVILIALRAAAPQSFGRPFVHLLRGF